MSTPLVTFSKSYNLWKFKIQIEGLRNVFTVVPPTDRQIWVNFLSGISLGIPKAVNFILPDFTKCGRDEEVSICFDEEGNQIIFTIEIPADNETDTSRMEMILPAPSCLEAFQEALKSF